MNEDENRSIWQKVAPVLVSLVTAAVAITLTWIAISAWSWRFWLTAAVGIIVFVQVLYILIVPPYLRMAWIILGAVTAINLLGGIHLSYQTPNGGYEFSYELNSPIMTIVLTVCFIAVIAADVIVTQRNRSGKSDVNKSSAILRNSGNNSDGAVIVHNSPGAHVSVGSHQASPHINDERSILIDVVRMQAGTIAQLISLNGSQLPKDRPLPPNKEGRGEGSPPEMYQVERTQEIDALTPDVKDINNVRTRADIDYIGRLVENIEAIDDLAAEIETHISQWNYNEALALANRLEDLLRNPEALDRPSRPEYKYLIARVHVIYARNNDTNKDGHIDHAICRLSELEKLLSASTDPDLGNRVYALRGSIEHLKNGPDAALQLLDSRDDPDALRVRIAMHLKLNKPEQAISLIDGKPPHLRWCDLGVAAYMSAGRRDDATTLVLWTKAQGDQSKYQQCIVQLADVGLAYALKSYEQH